MDLDQQIQTLINNAPQDGTTPLIVDAIGPVLKLLAQQLQHLDYYLLQTLDERWVLTTLSHRMRPDLSKRVIYAFSSHTDALSFRTPKAPEHAIAVPVTHILFQMIAMPNLDSLVFFESGGNLATGTEITREQVQDLFRCALEQYRVSSPSGTIPPDIA